MQKRDKIITNFFLTFIIGMMLIKLTSIASLTIDSFARLIHKESGITSTIKNYESRFNDLYSSNDIWIQLYGGIQNVLQKNEINGFEVVKDRNNQLYLGDSGIITTDSGINSVKAIYDTAQELNCPFLFVQVPFKNFEDITELKYYGKDNTETQFNNYLQKLDYLSIPYIDLRQYEETREFYKTDHHWTNRASFYGNQYIVSELNKLYNLNLDESVLKENHFYTENYGKTFLGSLGVKVGDKYVGKDDFNILYPNYQTSFEYSHYVKGKLTVCNQGDFSKAMINHEILNNNYKNKYNSFLYGGFNENIIKNESLKGSGKKCLVISHSYARTMVMYTGLVFREVRYLDPQDGRFNDDYTKYIKEYNPDVIIVMYNSYINVG